MNAHKQQPLALNWRSDRRPEWLWTGLGTSLILVVASSFAQTGEPTQRIAGVERIAIGPAASLRVPRPPSTDYLIDGSQFRTVAHRNEAANTIALSNGLIRRVWRISPTGACVALDNLMTGHSLLRAVSPEATAVIDGKPVTAGGLLGQPNLAYLREAWLDSMVPDPDSLRLVSVRTGPLTERIAWGRRRHHAPDAVWPPRGIALSLKFQALNNVQHPYTITVHYEMYDGIPLMSKWITVANESTRELMVDRLRVEELAVVEHSNWVETRTGVPVPAPECIHVETDFAFGGFTHANANRHTVRWLTDPEFKTQVNYELKTPCRLVVEPTYGPAQSVPPGGSFTSFRAFELIYDHGDRERRGLTLRRMYRTLAPWVTENPITHHLLNSNPEQVRLAIDQAAEAGFEAIIMSFGSGFDMENPEASHLKEWKAVADYAELRGIELGAYSLFSSRSVGGGNDVVSPAGERPQFGKAPAATSEWGIRYFQQLKRFYDTTGFDQFENDGPYPGDVDITPRPPYQKGEQDSRWAQWKVVTGLYTHLRANGVYINQPDYYFLMGGNKTGMGYREVNWSLPREQQIIHTRQNIYDGTWTKTPSMGWMHVPLSQYHGGGAAATIEPLRDHLDHYRQMMLCNLGLGVQAHYRGPRLFDTDQTKNMVRATVDWFKEHRDILESDLIHCRRADGRDLDWMLHVNPRLATKGMLCVFNPLPEKTSRQILVDLYYTGLTDKVRVRSGDGNEETLRLDRKYRVRLDVSVPPGEMAWFRFF